MLSNDRQTWVKAPMLPQLGMDWLVELTSEHYYGPTTLGALQEFIRLGEIDAETLVINTRKGQTPITISLQQVKLYKVLQVICDMADLEPVPMHNIYYITTPENAKRLAKREFPQPDEPMPGMPKPKYNWAILLDRRWQECRFVSKSRFGIWNKAWRTSAAR